MGLQSLSWLLFGVIVVVLLVIDLGILNKKDEVMSFKKSLLISLFYILISCLFGLFIFYEFGADRANEYYTGFLLEKAMSLDNIFVISIIFKFFKIPQKYQHRVLFWGILGVIIFRAIMIFAGSVVLAKFEWVLFIFATILVITGIKTLYIVGHNSIDVKNMLIYKWLSSHINIHHEIEGNKFTIRKDGKIFFTPLFISLITIEFMDLIFAIDSIPAIFAITQDVFVVYTSNIFAILGLRALFFCLEDVVERFAYVKYSLAIILILIGVKIFVSPFIDIPKLIPLIISLFLIVVGIVISIAKNKNASN